MKLKSILILTLLAGVLAGCTEPLPPAVEPQGDARFLIDPRTGYDKPSDPNADRKLDAAWRYFLAGNDAEAAKRIRETGGYPPASLLTAALAIRSGNLNDAGAIVSRLLDEHPAWTAARVYAAEISLAHGDAADAYRLYRQIANPPPIVATRTADVEKRMFDQITASAQSMPPAQAVSALREALQLEPTASAVRMMLVQKLLALKNFEEARRELDPVLNTEADRVDVQEALAEIEVGRGRYQEAIVRYDRLVKRTNDPRYVQRLNQLKDDFANANMPPQFLRARESDAITRADFAVLLYWKVPSIRFAQNLAVPPIAVDLESDVSGREEMIRAIALGIFPVDPVTRRASPSAQLSAAATARAAARALTSRGAACAHDAGNDPQKVLAACGVIDPAAGTLPEATVTGRLAAQMAEEIDRVLK